MSNEKSAAPGVDDNTAKSNEIARSVMGSGVKADGFRVEYSDGRATVRGSVGSEEDRKKVLDTVRGVGGVASVTDSMTVGEAGATGATGAATAAGARTYTVKSGDTLSAIAKTHYGDASKYNKIFNANRDILSDADKIQPGQVLKLPE